MRTRPTILYYSPDAHTVPDLVRQWADGKDIPVSVLRNPADVHAIVLRGFPALVFIDGDRAGPEARAMVRLLKNDAYTAITPVIVLSAEHSPEAVEEWFAVGADEVVTSVFAAAEQRARLESVLVSTERDVSVHPSTRLPGTTEIERELRRRLDSGGLFAVCYADLDHFKEFNDRYSYYDGDRVIYMLSRILHDVVKGLCGTDGFVGHIGGDDFIFVIPIEQASPGLQRDPRGLRHPDPAAVQRAGPPSRLLLRQGPPGPVAPGAADDPVDRHRDQPAPPLHPPGPGQRAGHGNEELREDPAGLGIRRGSATAERGRRSGGPTSRHPTLRIA